MIRSNNPKIINTIVLEIVLRLEISYRNNLAKVMPNSTRAEILVNSEAYQNK